MEIRPTTWPVASCRGTSEFRSGPGRQGPALLDPEPHCSRFVEWDGQSVGPVEGQKTPIGENRWFAPPPLPLRAAKSSPSAAPRGRDSPDRRQFVALAARAVEELVGLVAVGEALGDRVPLQGLADPADVADDVDQVAERGGPLADLDVGVAAACGS